MSANWKISLAGDHIVGSFVCMASPCELLIDSTNVQLAEKITEQAAAEAFRIEKKYSRYSNHNIIFAINNAQGKVVSIDKETFQLLSFANTCYDLSDGLFDVTSGVLRHAWKFDGSDNIPNQEQIDALTPLVDWTAVSFDSQKIVMPTGFEIDLGGIGKEYAVDCVANICRRIAPNLSVLVNFGGDIQVTCPKKIGQYWQVGVELPRARDTPLPNNELTSKHTTYETVMVRIAQGGLATSGDANRFLLKDGVRYSHVLNPKLGKPVQSAPRSITVASEQCIQAGLLATLALLQGAQAEQFLLQQEVTHWCYW